MKINNNQYGGNAAAAKLAANAAKSSAGKDNIPEVEGFDPGTKALEIGMTVVSGGAFGFLAIIGLIIQFIIRFLYLLLVEVIPFVVTYFGIPLFILGLIIGVFFLGGHILFTIVFIGGMFFYFKGLGSVIYKLPKSTEYEDKNNNSNSDYKVKI